MYQQNEGFNQPLIQSPLPNQIYVQPNLYSSPVNSSPYHTPGSINRSPASNNHFNVHHTNSDYISSRTQWAFYVCLIQALNQPVCSLAVLGIVISRAIQYSHEHNTASVAVCVVTIVVDWMTTLFYFRMKSSDKYINQPSELPISQIIHQSRSQGRARSAYFKTKWLALYRLVLKPEKRALLTTWLNTDQSIHQSAQQSTNCSMLQYFFLYDAMFVVLMMPIFIMSDPGASWFTSDNGDATQTFLCICEDALRLSMIISMVLTVVEGILWRRCSELMAKLLLEQSMSQRHYSNLSTPPEYVPSNHFVESPSQSSNASPHSGNQFEASIHVDSEPPAYSDHAHSPSHASGELSHGEGETKSGPTIVLSPVVLSPRVLADRLSNSSHHASPDHQLSLSQSFEEDTDVEGQQRPVLLLGQSK